MLSSDPTIKTDQIVLLFLIELILSVITGIKRIPAIPKTVILHLFIFVVLIIDFELALITLTLVLPKIIITFLKEHLTISMACLGPREPPKKYSAVFGSVTRDPDPTLESNPKDNPVDRPTDPEVHKVSSFYAKWEEEKKKESPFNWPKKYWLAGQASYGPALTTTTLTTLNPMATSYEKRFATPTTSVATDNSTPNSDSSTLTSTRSSVADPDESMATTTTDERMKKPDRPRRQVTTNDNQGSGSSTTNGKRIDPRMEATEVDPMAAEENERTPGDIQSRRNAGKRKNLVLIQQNTPEKRQREEIWRSVASPDTQVPVTYKMVPTQFCDDSKEVLQKRGSDEEGARLGLCSLKMEHGKNPKIVFDGKTYKNLRIWCINTNMDPLDKSKVYILVQLLEACLAGHDQLEDMNELFVHMYEQSLEGILSLLETVLSKVSLPEGKEEEQEECYCEMDINIAKWRTEYYDEQIEQFANSEKVVGLLNGLDLLEIERPTFSLYRNRHICQATDMKLLEKIEYVNKKLSRPLPLKKRKSAKTEHEQRLNNIRRWYLYQGPTIPKFDKTSIKSALQELKYVGKEAKEQNVPGKCGVDSGELGIRLKSAQGLENEIGRVVKKQMTANRKMLYEYMIGLLQIEKEASDSKVTDQTDEITEDRVVINQQETQTLIVKIVNLVVTCFLEDLSTQRAAERYQEEALKTITNLLNTEFKDLPDLERLSRVSDSLIFQKEKTKQVYNEEEVSLTDMGDGGGDYINYVNTIDNNCLPLKGVCELLKKIIRILAPAAQKDPFFKIISPFLESAFNQPTELPSKTQPESDLSAKNLSQNNLSAKNLPKSNLFTKNQSESDPPVESLCESELPANSQSESNLLAENPSESDTHSESIIESEVAEGAVTETQGNSETEQIADIVMDLKWVSSMSVEDDRLSIDRSKPCEVEPRPTVFRPVFMKGFELQRLYELEGSPKKPYERFEFVSSGQKLQFKDFYFKERDLRKQTEAQKYLTEGLNLASTLATKEEKTMFHDVTFHNVCYCQYCHGKRSDGKKAPGVRVCPCDVCDSPEFFPGQTGKTTYTKRGEI